jgi:hypothetical protein
VATAAGRTAVNAGSMTTVGQAVTGRAGQATIAGLTVGTATTVAAMTATPAVVTAGPLGPGRAAPAQGVARALAGS